MGTVRDRDTEAPVPGALVSLVDLGRAAMTGPDGRYVFSGVPAGPQHVSVRIMGYAPRTLHALVPRAGTLELHLYLARLPQRLPAIAVRPAIVVRGSAGDAAPSFVDRGASFTTMRNDPLLTDPDALQVLTSGDVVMRPESPSGVHVRGGAADHTGYLLDGIPVFSPYHSSGVFSAWNADALEGVQLGSSVPSPGHPHALSGSVAATTRTPGEQLLVQNTVSNTHWRLTADGPLRRGRPTSASDSTNATDPPGFLIAVREGYPHLFSQRNDPAYLRGSSADRMAKIETPAFGGRARLLVYDATNETSATAVVDTAPSAGGGSSPRNTFEWDSRSAGIEWARTASFGRLRALAWSATGGAESGFLGRLGRLAMTSTRSDAGVSVAADRHRPRNATTIEARVERMRTNYGVAYDTVPSASSGFRRSVTMATLFTQREDSVGRTNVKTGVTIIMTDMAGRAARFAPHAHIQWSPARLPTWTLLASYARRFQFAQSVRNPESLVSNIFPADLFLGSGATVPVARSDQGIVAIDLRPSANVHLGVQGYLRRIDGLVLVAPFDDEPFATTPFGVGTGTSRGMSIDAALGASRYGVVASYGLQRVRHRVGAIEYVPDHGSSRLFDGGVLVFPTATSSIRFGVSHAAGRRATNVAGPFEWESCNIRDRGCEFGGTPRYLGQQLGGRRLPPYLRADLGVRKHWHARLGQHDGRLELFGALTNVLGRMNVLTYATDPATGTPTVIDMRPQSPLVIGLDWRY